METKLCECGCGQPAPIALRTSTRNGWVKGQPKRYINNHHSKGRVGVPTYGNLKHGGYCNGKQSPEYISYRAMLARCTKPNHDKFRFYGGRGISICPQWLDKKLGFSTFLTDMGLRPTGTTIDRRDNSGNYEPENCYWATVEQQNLNRRPRMKKAA